MWCLSNRTYVYLTRSQELSRTPRRTKVRCLNMRKGPPPGDYYRLCISVAAPGTADESELAAPKRPAADMGAAHAEETLPGSLIQLVSWVQRDGHEEVTLLTTARGRTKCRLGPQHEKRNANLDCCGHGRRSRRRDAPRMAGNGGKSCNTEARQSSEPGRNSV